MNPEVRLSRQSLGSATFVFQSATGYDPALATKGDAKDARTEAQLEAYRAMPRAKRREFDRAAKRALKKLRRGV